MGIVAYYRVSTARQGASGLGLEGQGLAVEAYARQHGKRIIAEYTEVESGCRIRSFRNNKTIRTTGAKTGANESS